MEKFEIIRLVDSSHLGVKRTLDKLGVARPTFYPWYARYLARGEAGLSNHYRGPARPWNRLPGKVGANSGIYLKQFWLAMVAMCRFTRRLVVGLWPSPNSVALY